MKATSHNRRTLEKEAIARLREDLPIMATESTSSQLEVLRNFCSRLTWSERKALITLARSQSIPEKHTSPALYEKVEPILNAFAVYPPYESLSEPLFPEAHLIINLLSSPLTTGVLIVFALGVSLSDEQVQYGKDTSFAKELLATQSVPRGAEWNWDAIISPSLHAGEVIHPLFPRLSSLQRTFSRGVGHLYFSYRNRVIFPHYSRRGISTESTTYLLNRIPRDRYRVCKYGNPRTFHGLLNRKNVSSKDIVHHYMRTGDWIRGRTEMKQRWYPSGLLPRTYFSWGGCAISASSYLREFFNDLGDTFKPTERRNRVLPSWLQHPTRTESGGFMFYDLISFTSWFHEQESFLRSIASRFHGVNVFLVSEGLTLVEHDIGTLIDSYIDSVNSSPEFYVSKSVSNGRYGEESFVHKVAGFLGVPGNLITCTIPHGLAIASLLDSDRELQVPGDDVGAAFDNEYHRLDISTCAQTLGGLQMDKVFSTPGLCLYLKRLVVDLFNSLSLSPMLIYPLLPYLINPTGDYRSNQFRLPDPKVARSRAAAVLVSFRRDIWNMTKGEMNDDSRSILFLFIRRVHEMVGLPFEAIFQGRVYAMVEDDQHLFPDITVKFDTHDIASLNINPDLEFASSYIHRMTIRSTYDVPLTQPFRELSQGQIIVVNRSKKWSFLEDMGYARVVGIPGEKVELIGSDARDAYLFAVEPPLREVEILSDISTEQLVAVGILKDPDGEVFEGRDDTGSRHVDLNTRSWRYRRYVDLDDPRTSALYGSGRDWVNNHLPRERSSLSPEPQDVDLDY